MIVIKKTKKIVPAVDTGYFKAKALKDMGAGPFLFDE